MKKQIMTACVLLALTSLQAHDFSVTGNGQTLYFSVTDSIHHHVAVTFEGKAADASRPKAVSGIVEIPARVSYGKRTYQVTGIADKAFCNADQLEGIVMPSGLTAIGAFAFEGCQRLQTVIFPSNEVTVGEGAFFRCPSVSRVSIGTEWTGVDLRMFRWSDSLAELNIPARLRRLHNLKALRRLERITVDGASPYYRSVDGMLYNADATQLLACPRAYAGKVVVAEGATAVARDAMSDCLEVTEVELPASLATLCYREFSRMGRLTSVTFKSAAPIATALHGGKQVFALQVRPAVTVNVPKDALKDYKQQLVGEAGEYSLLDTHDTLNLPVSLQAGQLAQPTQLKAVKTQPDKQ